ncbi:MAG: hypothetical protein V4858_17245 [Pseudomonadota bacterium]
MQSQVDENTSQAKQREQQTALSMRRQAEREALLGTGRVDGGLLAPGAGPAPAGPQTTGAVTPEQQAALSKLPPPPPQVQTKLEQLSAQYGIPLDALKFDLVFNDGKNMAEWVQKRGTPDMQVSGNYAYDRNKLGAGFMPSLTTSTTGQTSMTRIGPDGLPVVSAPQGALETYGAYKAADAGLKPIKVFNPVTQREEFTSEAAVVGARPGGPAPMAGPGGNVQSPAYSGGSRDGANAESVRMMESELQNPALKPEDRAGIQREIARMKLQTPTAFAAGPSAAEATKAATDKEYAVNATKDIGETRKTIMNAGFAAPSTISKYQQLGKLLQDVDGGTLTATGTNIASTMNSLGFKVDKNLPNKEAAAALGNEMALELRNPANGAGMPGAMSDADRNYLVSMIPNASQSAAGRKQLLEAKIAVEQRKIQTATFARNYEKKYGRLDNGFFEQMSAWSSQNTLFKGK